MSKQAQSPAATEPVFVNELDIPIQVFDENRRMVLVMPYMLKGRHPNGVYEVKGEFYRQFAQPGANQLTPFRAQGAPIPPAPVDVPPVRPAPEIHPERSGQETRPDYIPNLDTMTSVSIQRASPNATPGDRSLLAAYVLNKRAGKPFVLPPALVSYVDIMDKIVDGDHGAAQETVLVDDVPLPGDRMAPPVAEEPEGVTEPPDSPDDDTEVDVSDVPLPGVPKAAPKPRGRPVLSGGRK